MKFTKEQAFEILRSFLTNGGKKTLRMSEKSMNAQLDTLIPLVANDEMELNDFVEKVKPTFTTMNSNAEKDNSDFIKQWEKDHPNPDPNSDPEGKKDDPEGKKDDPAMKKLLERLAALEAKDAAAAEAAAVAQKRTELIAKMKEKGIDDTEWIDSFLGEVTIDKDVDIEAKAESFLKIYNKTKSVVNPTATPRTNGAPANDDNPLKAASDLMKSMREAKEKLAQ